MRPISQLMNAQQRSISEEINKVRAAKGFNPLEIVEVPFILAEDGTPLASIKIRYGEMDLHGKKLNHSRIQ